MTDPLTLSPPHVLREYALLADGERGILVGPRGDFAWMCFPRWHSDACFASLIGGRGAFAVTPQGRYVWGGYYEVGLIWRSRWITEGGTIECREALAAPGERSRAVILRRVTAVEGPARLDVAVDPRADFGDQGARRLRRDDSGVWHGVAGETHLHLSGLPEASAVPDGQRGHLLRAELALEAGESRDLVLVLDLEESGGPCLDPDRVWEGTETFWREQPPAALSSLSSARDARHSHAVLAGLTSADGGMVAAATMSMPERARQGRSYDYRYAWIRDQCMAGQAFARAGAVELLDGAVSFVGERLLADGPTLNPAYTVDGARVPEERRLGLPGYPGGSDVVGNWVREQFQLDAFGEALLLFAAAADHDRLDAQAWRAAEVAVAAIEKRWREADAGIWEVEPAEWIHSRLICVTGLRRLAAHQPPARGAALLALADTMAGWVAEHGVHPSGRWQRATEDPGIDAALLLPIIRGGVDPHEPRSLATVAAVESDLVRDGYCYRFRPDERPLGEAEGAFLLCGFLMSLVLAAQDRPLEAARWFERSRAASGPPGLLSEEFDVRQRQLRGNLPQAFVHAALLETAVVVDEQ
ncbi:MAG TPA: glycoside hydrolase family 15 protein [Solirubrobacteraceae bacterium]|nr:glycoside hydrolase family 15 protein [Solirubrobacteraceae bacterium]